MIDTNALSQFQQAAPQVQSTFSAWNLVFAGVGAFLAHAYHSIKGEGGIKNILRGLWDGGPELQPQIHGDRVLFAPPLDIQHPFKPISPSTIIPPANGSPAAGSTENQTHE